MTTMTWIQSVERMSGYQFETVWMIGAAVEDVWNAIVASERWPDWWPYLESSVKIASGDSEGRGAIHRFAWRGPVPCRVSFEIMVTKIEHAVLLEGVASGDLEGTGRWTFAEVGTQRTRVQYDWSVRTTRTWMNLIAPLAKPVFTWNHDRVMRAGGEGFAKYLRASLPGKV